MFWFSTLSYLYSVPADGDVTMSIVGEASVSTRAMLMYMVFNYLWVCAFLSALFHASVAGIVGSWYFNRHHVPANSPIVSSWMTLWRNVTVSAGSLAFGSLVMGIIGFLRYLLKKAENVSKKQPALATVFKCCKCCLCCLEKFIDIINKYAYVYVAMENCTFCAGAKKSYGLISNYPIQVRPQGQAGLRVPKYCLSSLKHCRSLQMVVMRAINGFVLFCGKLFLTLTTMVFFLLFMDKLGREFCVLFVVLCSLGMFQVFRFQANIIAAASDTIFVCYVMDLNLNNGEAIHMQTSAGLHAKVQAAVSEYEKENPSEVQLTNSNDRSSDSQDGESSKEDSPLTAPARP